MEEHVNRKILAFAAALAGISLGFSLAAHPAQANETPAFQTQAPTCTMPSGWYANSDEQNRLPEPVPGGLEFSGSDLIHHAAATTVETLNHGTFTASPAPDQPSFFSVEVYGTDGGYGTLRWNTTTSKWNLVTGGQFYENTDPAALADMPPVHRSHKVVSFGVGYTLNPPGTVTTTVSSVTFAGKTYDLTCHTATPTPTKTPTTPPTSPRGTPTSEPTGAPTTSATATGALAITGPNLPKMIGVGLIVITLGLLAVFAVQRRKTHFRP